MRRVLLMAFAAASLASFGETTNVTKTVEVKGWKRTYIYGTGDGRIIDPSGQIADGVTAQSLKETQARISKVLHAAHESASNQVAKLYAVTNRLDDFTKRIFVQVHLYPDMQRQSNMWSCVAREWTDGEYDHVWVYFAKKLKVPPVMKRAYRSETSTNYVEGVWTDFENQSEIVDGYEGCREIVYKRPAEFVGRVTFRDPYIKFGTQENGFDFGTRVFNINGEFLYTGTFTNANNKIHRWNNGVRVGGEEDAL